MAGLVSVLGLTAGCAAGRRSDQSSATTQAPVVAADATKSLDASGVTFRHPAAWRAQTSTGAASSFSEPIAALSNQQLHDPCRSPSPGAVYCSFPLASLPPGGVLATVSENGFPGLQPDRWPGQRLTIDGMQTWLSTGKPSGECPPGADQVITARYLRTDVPDNYFEITVCARSPGLAQVRAETARMVESFRTTGT